MSKVWLVTGSASDLDRDIAEAVLSSCVREAPGREHRSFEEFARDYAPLFARLRNEA
jgi:hypothetical protein